MSKKLPPKANLAHLKKQAKDLQRTHRAGEQEASLRLKANLPRLSKVELAQIRNDELSLQEAQNVIAREYGFAHWAALRQAINAPAGSDGQIAQLRKAINTGNTKVLSALLAENPDLVEVNLAQRGRRPCPTLTYAAGDNAEGPQQVEIIRLLLDAGAQMAEEYPDGGQAALARAATQGNVPVMEVLVEYGLEAQTFQDGRTIMGPCESLNPEGLRFLLAHGADPNFTTDNMGSPLDLVICTYAHSKRNECLDILIEAGAHFEDCAEMDILRGRVDLLEQRLDQQPDLVHHHSNFRQGGEFGGVYGGAVLQRPTLLHICAEFNELGAAELLLSRGANVNARAQPDAQGAGNQTPIYHAVASNFNKSFPMLEWLLAHGADLSVRADLRVPKQGGQGANEGDPLLAQVTPLEYALQYPNDYQPGPGSGVKGLDREIHQNVAELLHQAGGQ